MKEVILLENNKAQYKNTEYKINSIEKIDEINFHVHLENEKENIFINFQVDDISLNNEKFKTFDEVNNFIKSKKPAPLSFLRPLQYIRDFFSA